MRMDIRDPDNNKKVNFDCKNEYDFHKDPNNTSSIKLEYHKYNVLKPFNVMTCIAAPIMLNGYFASGVGGATQYRLFEGSLTEEKDKAKITDKKEFPGKKVPNVDELINNVFIKEIPNSSFPAFA